MKRSVNLYQAALQVQPNSYRLSTLVHWLSLCLLVALVLFGWLQWQIERTAVTTQQQQQLINASSEALDQLQQTLAQRQPDAALTQQLQQLQASNLQKQQLRLLLQQTAAGPRPRFSLVLTDLASADLPGFWLVGFRLSQQDIRFQGMTRDASQLPGWLQQLGQSEFLRQRSFGKVAVQPATADYWQFEVASTAQAVSP